MLFSDIEASTKLLSRLGDQYGAALSAQRGIPRSAITAGQGHEIGTEGDSFFVVFGSAVEAVRCCITAQRALYRHHWPGGTAVRVRMGLHSGEPMRHEDGYIGLDVHRAARIAAAAHGGQVVLSDATRLLVESRLPSARKRHARFPAGRGHAGAFPGSRARRRGTRGLGRRAGRGPGAHPAAGDYAAHPAARHAGGLIPAS